jgi:DNA polymerase-3 subunit delta'
MGFAELIGHERPLESLRSALAHERLHHAYLFSGPEGVGKRTVALALARAIHCSEANGDFCGRCTPCVSITDGNHADVRLILTLPGKKEIGIQQIREMERELRYCSFGGKRKIAIVDPAALMNVPAQNALLKTLEEPPQNSLIILIAQNAGALLPTLRSRCLPLTFAPVPRAQIASFLQRQYHAAPEAAAFRAAMSNGSIGAAASLEREDMNEKRRNWANLIDSLAGRDYRAAIAAAEELGQDRDDALAFLRWAETWFRDRLIYCVAHCREELVNIDLLERIEQDCGRSSTAAALAALAGISEAAAGIQRNFNRRMVLEKLFFTIIERR